MLRFYDGGGAIWTELGKVASRRQYQLGGGTSPCCRLSEASGRRYSVAPLAVLRPQRLSRRIGGGVSVVDG